VQLLYLVIKQAESRIDSVTVKARAFLCWYAAAAAAALLFMTYTGNLVMLVKW